MILVARNVAEALVDYADKMAQTPLMKAARTLPGYGTYKRAIQSQYAVGAAGEDRHSQPRPERVQEVEPGVR